MWIVDRLIDRRVDLRLEKMLEDTVPKVVERRMRRLLKSPPLTCDYGEVAFQTVPSGSIEVYRAERSSPFILSGFVDLTRMKPGDAISVTIEMQIKEGNRYSLYRHVNFDDKPAEPLVYIHDIIVPSAVKISIAQGAGIGTKVEHIWFKR